MADTYKKPDLLVDVRTLVGAQYEGFSVAVYETIKAHKTVVTDVDNGNGNVTVLIPFHAVDNVSKFIDSVSTKTKVDPYCSKDANVVKFVNDGIPCGDGSVTATFPVPVTITEENRPIPTPQSCSGSGYGYNFETWEDDEHQAIEYPITLTEPKTYHSRFRPVY